MNVRYAVRAWGLVTALVVMFLGGCFGHSRHAGVRLESRLASSSEGLPGEAARLVVLVNSLLSEPPDDYLLIRALASAEKAVRVAPGYRTRWRASRAASYVASWHSERSVRLEALGRGSAHARAAIEAAPDRVGGHFFLAVNLGLRIRMEPDAALSGLDEVVRLCEKAREIDPKFQQGGPARILGGLYAKAPPWPASIGDIEESEEILTELVATYPDYPLNQFFLGETLMKLSDYERAEQCFRIVLRARPTGIWCLEGPHYRTQARQRLKDIERIRTLRR